MGLLPREVCTLARPLRPHRSPRPFVCGAFFIDEHEWIAHKGAPLLRPCISPRPFVCGALFMYELRNFIYEGENSIYECIHLTYDTMRPTPQTKRGGTLKMQ